MKSIKWRLFLFTLSHLILLIVAIISVYINVLEMNSHSTNKAIAERQLALTQILTREAMNIIYNSDDQEEFLEGIKSTSKIFELNLIHMKVETTKVKFSGNLHTEGVIEDLFSIWKEYKKNLTLIFRPKEIPINDFFKAVDLISELEYDLYLGVHTIIKAHEDDYDHHVKILNIVFYLFVLAEIIFIVVRWVAVNKLIFIPLEEISKVIKRRRTIDDYEEQIPANRKDEIGTIVNAINESGARLVTTTEQLRLSETHQRGLIDHAVDAIISIDQEGTITLFNKAACRIFEYSEEDALGMKLTELIPEKYKVCHETGLKNYLESGDSHVIGTVKEFDGISKSKELIPFSISVWECETAADHTFTAILRDAREGKKRRLELEKAYRDIEKAYQELKNAQSQLIQGEKMASIGLLAAGVAHEINNPIGFINSNLSTMDEYVKDVTEILEKENLLEQEVEQFLKKTNGEDASEMIPEEKNLVRLLEEIQELKKELDLDFVIGDMQSSIQESMEGAERVRDIISSLKDYAHVDDEQKNSIDMNDCIDSTLKIAWNELKYKVELKKEYGDVPELYCHPTQIKQVIMNLLINAAHAIDKKGEIKIETSQKENNICLKISDTGHGIPKENISKLFDPFFTTKEIGKGTGLGLNICYNIVEKHNGSIHVESEVGVGTTFTIMLPIEEEECEESEA